MSRDWFKEQRQQWIAETLRIFGFIRREHIERKFGVSTQQASIDLSAFRKENPRAIEYDSSAKLYRSPSYPDRRDAVA